MNGPDPAMLGVAIQIFFYLAGGIGGIMLAVAQFRNIFKKGPPAPDSEYVTRGELMRHLVRVDMDIKEQRNHAEDLGRKLHVINLRIVHMTDMIGQLCHKNDLPVLPGPVIDVKDDA